MLIRFELAQWLTYREPLSPRCAASCTSSPAATSRRQRRRPSGRASSPSRRARSAGWRRSPPGWPPGRAATRRCVAHPRVAVFAGNHGVAARGVSAYPGGGDGADGAELHRTAAPRSTSCTGGRRRAARLRDRPRRAHGRFHRGARHERGGLRQGDGLRHDGGRAGRRPAVPGRDGHRQHDQRRGALPSRSSAARRPSGPGRAPASPARRCSARARSWRPALARHRDAMATRSRRCAASAGSSWPPSPAR